MANPWNTRFLLKNYRSFFCNKSAGMLLAAQEKNQTPVACFREQPRKKHKEKIQPFLPALFPCIHADENPTLIPPCHRSIHLLHMSVISSATDTAILLNLTGKKVQDKRLSFSRAGVAQLVEYKLPKLGVAGSIPVSRSTPGNVIT